MVGHVCMFKYSLASFCCLFIRYLIDQSWMKTFRRFTGLEEAERYEIPKPPGPINNEGLIGNCSFHLNYIYHYLLYYHYLIFF